MRPRCAHALYFSALLALAASSPALARPHHGEASGSEARREWHQLMGLEAALAAQPSATRALEDWCGILTGTAQATITASPVAGHDALLPPDARTLLRVAGTEPLGYRHVQLSCSLGTMSEAHNWYVPARLTPEMNIALATTDTPFGKVVAPLHFTREPLASQRSRGHGCPSRTILTHRAVLRMPDGQPLALLVECYSVLNLAPPPPVLTPLPEAPDTPGSPCCTAPQPARIETRPAPPPSNPPSPTLR